MSGFCCQHKPGEQCSQHRSQWCLELGPRAMTNRAVSHSKSWKQNRWEMGSGCVGVSPLKPKSLEASLFVEHYSQATLQPPHSHPWCLALVDWEWRVVCVCMCVHVHTHSCLCLWSRKCSLEKLGDRHDITVAKGSAWTNECSVCPPGSRPASHSLCSCGFCPQTLAPLCFQPGNSMSENFLCGIF